ncbi:MAG TPA: ABATE domain-containing protein [Roseiflexaceae bacterium]|nr:ABATE domain-containing protein [Roseiflexaceae bacterium]
MLEFNTHAGNVRLIGGRLCLDFVNTVDCHYCAEPKEYLVDYPALVIWAQHAGLLCDEAADRLLHEAERRPSEAGTALEHAKRLRHALYRIFTDPAGSRADMPEQIGTLNRALAETADGLEIRRTPAGYAWGGKPSRLDQLLGPLAWSAAELLASADLNLVHECEGERCSWLFLDTSRNHSRRWCSMVDCGNRAKARRYYAQRRVASTARL